MRKSIISIVLVILSFGIARTQDLKFNVRAGISANHPELASFNQGKFPLEVLSILLTGEEEILFEENRKTGAVTITDFPTYNPKQGFIIGASLMYRNREKRAIEVSLDYKKNSGDLNFEKTVDESKVNLNSEYTINSVGIGLRLYPTESSFNLKPFILTGLGIHNITFNNNLRAIRKYHHEYEIEVGKEEFEVEYTSTRENGYNSDVFEFRYSFDLGFGFSYKIFDRLNFILESVYSFAKKDRITVPGRIISFDEDFDVDEVELIDSIMKPDLSGMRLNLTVQIELFDHFPFW